MEGFGRGKIILLGEHSVVYGRAALGAGIERGVRARLLPLAPGEEASATLRVPAWDLTLPLSPAPEEPLAQAVLAVRALYERERGAPLPPCSVEAEVGLPAGAGLGCSAAFGVALVRALDASLGVDRPPGEVAERSLAWERVFHGNPSGLDSALSALGGAALFRRGEAPTPAALRRPLWLAVADSGRSSSTKAMVDDVARQHQKEPGRVEPLFDAIEAIVLNGRGCLREGDLPGLGKLMDLNHGLLSTLLLSTPALESIRGIAKEAGALGSKLTGAGGGGCAIALAADQEGAMKIRDSLIENGFSSFVAAIGEEASVGDPR